MLGGEKELLVKRAVHTHDRGPAFLKGLQWFTFSDIIHSFIMLLTQHCHKKAMKSVYAEEGILWLVLWGISPHDWLALAVTQPGGKAEGTKLFPCWPRSTRKRTLLLSLWRASCRLSPRTSLFMFLLPPKSTTWKTKPSTHDPWGPFRI